MIIGYDGFLIQTHYDSINSDNKTESHFQFKKLKGILEKLKSIGLDCKSILN